MDDEVPCSSLPWWVFRIIYCENGYLRECCATTVGLDDVGEQSSNESAYKPI